MKKHPNSSSQSAQLKRAGARLLSDVSSVPSRIHRHVIRPIQASTGQSFKAARRAMAPMQACTVGSVASFVAAVLGLDANRNRHAV